MPNRVDADRVSRDLISGKCARRARYDAGLTSGLEQSDQVAGTAPDVPIDMPPADLGRGGDGKAKTLRIMCDYPPHDAGLYGRPPPPVPESGAVSGP
jgi:hypothetical protein